MRILQKPQIVSRASGYPLFNLNSVSGQDFNVTLRVLVQQAIFEPRSQHDVEGRSRFQNMCCSPYCSNQQDKHDYGHANTATSR